MMITLWRYKDNRKVVDFCMRLKERWKEGGSKCLTWDPFRTSAIGAECKHHGNFTDWVMVW